MNSKLAQSVLKLALILIGTFLVLYLGSFFPDVALAAVIAGLLFYLSLPIVSFLERKRVPRVLAVILVLVFFAVIISLLLLYLIPVIIEQLSALAEELPAILDRVETWANRIVNRFGGRVAERHLDTIVDQIASTAGTAIGTTASVIFTTLGDIVSVLIAVVAGVVAAFYLLKDHDSIRRSARRYIPSGSEQIVQNITDGTGRVLSGFLRGQIIVAITVGVLVGLALLLLGVPYAFLLAVIAAVFELVPYLGPVIAAIPAVLLALSMSPTTTFLVIVAFIIIQQIESLILSPKIVGEQVRLHPVTIIFAVLIGKQILGVLGIFLAVPVAGIAKVFAEQFLLSRQERQRAQEEE